MIQFYAPDIETVPQLPEGESAHCCRVLRKRTGDEIIVTNGKGARYIAEITDPHPTHTALLIKEKIVVPDNKGYNLTLAVAPTKNADRMEWLMEKAVEIGIDRIVLLKCERSERKILKPERLQKVMVSAMKQSLAVNLPVLEEVISFQEFVGSSMPDAQKYFGYCSERYPRHEFAEVYSPGGDVVIMIGPEGDFTESEVEKAVAEGFSPVTFGPKRLRTETAGLYAVCAVSTLNQRLK